MTLASPQVARQGERAFPPLACRIEGEGPNVVLIHGGAGSWTHWVRTSPALAARFKVHAYDLPGCGDSPDFPVDWSDEDYFKWVAAAILSDCQGPILLVGFSFGGSVAAAVAPLLGDRLKALCLVAPGSFGQPAPRDIDERPMRMRFGVEVDERANARHNLGQIMFTDIRSVDDATIDLQIANVRRARFPSRRISWQDRLEADLAPLRCPIQLIWGLGDRMATPSVAARADRVRAIKPEVEVSLIADGGHWIQYERAAEFNAALLPFLEKIDVGAKKP